MAIAKIPVDLTSTEINWLIKRYEQDATEAGAVGAAESVRYDDERIAYLSAKLTEMFGREV